MLAMLLLRRHPRLQPRELLLNLRHNPPLFGEGGDGNLSVANNSLADVRLRAAFALLDKLASFALEEPIQITRVESFGRENGAHSLIRRRVNS